jgi:hypothetical protein
MAKTWRRLPAKARQQLSDERLITHISRHNAGPISVNVQLSQYVYQLLLLPKERSKSVTDPLIIPHRSRLSSAELPVLGGPKRSLLIDGANPYHFRSIQCFDYYYCSSTRSGYFIDCQTIFGKFKNCKKFQWTHINILLETSLVEFKNSCSPFRFYAARVAIPSI